MNPEQHKPAFAEFVILMAMMTSIVALSIDGMLPALPKIGQELGVIEANNNQLILSLLFLGLAVGQLVFGPISDSTGRKRPIYAGFIVFMVGCILSIVSTNFSLMLLGRFLQGFGVAGPRAVSMALVRDRFEGEAMARVMSYVMTIFILAPMLAPAYGQAILAFATWRWIFASFILLAALTMVWFALRQPETLLPERRKAFSLGRILLGTKEVLNHRIAFSYTLAAGLIQGAFLGYLNSSQQIFQDQYGLGERFPLFFAIVALSLGGASFVNAQLVMRFGMKRLAHISVRALAVLSLLALAISYVQQGNPPFWQVMTYFLSAFFFVGILFGNLNAIAMQPLGHIAGIGSAIVGSLGSLISVPIGTYVGLSYNGTILPILMGLSLLSVLSIGVMIWAEGTRKARVLRV
ncbi:MAG: multidrug effflux MFS transporter [Trueperaceae bacterium]|nr:multidrug effflux MFS transporter [Trueperaceae bacterium]